MEGVLVGCGSITWPRDMDQKKVLAEIAEAGYDGAPAGPHGGVSAAEVNEMYASFGLKPAPGYLGANYWDVEAKDEILERAKMLSEFMAEVGCTELYVADNGFNVESPRGGMTRRELAAHTTPEDSLSEDQYKQAAETLNEVGELTQKVGVRICFHNHVGSFIETREEIDKLFSLVDRDLVFQGPDIGHLAWAGGDVVDFTKEYAEDIISLHLKDIYPDVLAEGQEKDWGYSEYSDNGIFAELGEGLVDFPGMFEVLEDVGYEGWLIVETDVTTKDTPLESAKISRAYLKSLGY